MSEKFDNRTVHHKMRRGEFTQGEYQKYLDSLPDDAEEGVETETRFAATFASRNNEAADAESSDD